MINLFDKIIERKNVEEAYFDLVSSLTKRGIKNKYYGINSALLDDYNGAVSNLIEDVRARISMLAELDPATSVSIPKKGGGTRNIYIYTIRDRIAAQAGARVLEDYFENLFSPFLFSYRKNKASFFASKSVVRRYKKNYESDFVLRYDLKNYTEFIDKGILKEKLKLLSIDEKSSGFLSLFIDNKILKDGKIFEREQGISQGNVLSTFFSNLYLNDVDHFVGPKVSLYRRVGDDFIAFDKSKEKLEKIKMFIDAEIINLRLVENKNKFIFGSAKEKFNFLGYSFEGGKIFLKENSFNEKMIEVKGRLLRSDSPEAIKRRLFSKKNGVQKIFEQIAFHHPHINDAQKIINADVRVHAFTAKSVYGKATPRFVRLAKKIALPSLNLELKKRNHG